MSLHGGLSAECADVFGVLSDFHLLDLLSEGGTVSVGELQSALCYSANICQHLPEWIARAVVDLLIFEVAKTLCRINDFGARAVLLRLSSCIR